MELLRKEKCKKQVLKSVEWKLKRQFPGQELKQQQFSQEFF